MIIMVNRIKATNLTALYFKKKYETIAEKIKIPRVMSYYNTKTTLLVFFVMIMKSF